MDGERWLGRGMDEVPGMAADWAWQQERAEIRRHIHAKLNHRHELVGARRFWATHRGRGVEWAIDRIQQRIHRTKPAMQERLRRQALERAAAGMRFTVEELQLIAERFAGANDPVGQAIEAKTNGILPAQDQGDPT